MVGQFPEHSRPVTLPDSKPLLYLRVAALACGVPAARASRARPDAINSRQAGSGVRRWGELAWVMFIGVVGLLRFRRFCPPVAIAEKAGQRSRVPPGGERMENQSGCKAAVSTMAGALCAKQGLLENRLAPGYAFGVGSDASKSPDFLRPGRCRAMCRWGKTKPDGLQRWPGRTSAGAWLGYAWNDHSQNPRERPCTARIHSMHYLIAWSAWAVVGRKTRRVRAGETPRGTCRCGA